MNRLRWWLIVLGRSQHSKRNTAPASTGVREIAVAGHTVYGQA